VSAARAISQIVRADFLERARRFGFLVTLAVTVYVAWLFLPPNHSRYATLQMGDHRGIYNSAWVGGLVAIMTNVFLSFAGFFVVKGAVDRDRRTGVGQILAATPLGRVEYTVGKWLSNFAVLAAMVAVMAIASAVMQIVLGEDRHLVPLVLLAPYVFVTLPAMAMVAAVAVMFETLPGLGGGLGNVVYFFAWILAFSLPMATSDRATEMNDLMGTGLILPGMLHACEAVYPGSHSVSGNFSLGFNVRSSGGWDLTTYRWDGVRWTGAMLLGRLAWMGAALGVAMAAAIPFDRFDGARALAPARRGRARGARSADAAAPDDASALAAPRPERAHVGALARVPRGFRFGAMLVGELRLLLNGLRVWYVVALGLAIPQAFAPLAVAAKFAAFAWIWPVLIWSALGSRESRHGTGSLLFSSAHPLARQLPAAWLAGLAVAIALGGAFGARLALAGHTAEFATWLAGAAFIPSLALALGVWTGSGKMFEVLYLVLWYCGPLNSTPVLDYTGGSGSAPLAGFAAAAAALAALAFAGRRRQLGA
jgi:hypothetical protein